MNSMKEESQHWSELKVNSNKKEIQDMNIVWLSLGKLV